MSFLKNLFNKKSTSHTPQPQASNYPSQNPLNTLTNVWTSLFGNDDFANDLLEGSKQALEDEKDIFYQIQTFFDEHQGYRNRLEKETLTFSGYQFTVGYILEVIMISRSSVCRQYLLNNNFLFLSGMGSVQQLPLVPDDDFSNMNFEEKEEIFDVAIDNISTQLNDADILFLDLVENLIQQLNTKRMQTDKDYQHFSMIDFNNMYQYPAITYSCKTNIGFNYLCEDYLSGNYSYYTTNTKHIAIYNIFDSIMFYAKICSRYSNTALYIQNFQTILRTEVDAGRGKTTTLLETLNINHPQATALIIECLRQISR